MRQTQVKLMPFGGESRSFPFVGDNIETRYAETSFVSLSGLLLLAVKALVFPVAPPALVAHCAAFELRAGSTNKNRSSTINRISAEVRLHVLFAHTLTIVARSLASARRSCCSLMAMLAEAAPGRPTSSVPVFAPKTCGLPVFGPSPVASPAQRAHRRTVLLSAGIAGAEGNTVGAIGMAAGTLADVVGRSVAIKAARHHPTTPLGSTVSLLSRRRVVLPRFTRPSIFPWRRYLREQFSHAWTAVTMA